MWWEAVSDDCSGCNTRLTISLMSSWFAQVIPSAGTTLLSTTLWKKYEQIAACMKLIPISNTSCCNKTAALEEIIYHFYIYFWLLYLQVFEDKDPRVYLQTHALGSLYSKVTTGREVFPQRVIQSFFPLQPCWYPPLPWQVPSCDSNIGREIVELWSMWNM